MDGTEAFRWGSPLGAGVVLFLLCGALYLLIGILTPLMTGRGGGGEILIVSARTDRVLFGSPPAELLRGDPALAQLRAILLVIVAGLLVAQGVLTLALAWFGLRQGHGWALAALVLAGASVLPYWWLALRPYLQAGAALELPDLPPFMWVPGALLVPAAVLGWMGLR